jgi:pyridoxine 5-phosphate synthase
MSAVKLSVNIDHVATLRQVRRAPYPDPVEAARLAEEAGASGITAHLRVDRRHIQDDDLHRLRAAVRGKLNVEMSVAAEMLAIAKQVRPDQVTLVPERPEEVTTEGGLDLLGHGEGVRHAAEQLAAAGIVVSAFVDPDPAQIDALARLSAAGSPGGASWIEGLEINTDAYTRAALAGSEADLAKELEKVREAAVLTVARGFRLYAGHGLTAANVGPIAALPGMEELNIGHSLVARSVALGLPGAVREMLAAMHAGR